MHRDEAWNIVTEYTASDSLRKHMLCVEAAMRAYAPRYEGDVELWGVVGLLHDFDYERYPDVAAQGHPVMGSNILRERGVSEDIIRAILSHATEVTGVERVTVMEKALYAVDELTGLITAPTRTSPKSICPALRRNGRTRLLPPGSTALRSSTPPPLWACRWMSTSRSCCTRCKRLRRP
jgi:putative nucleotidyltransferase with HDIG domain